MNEKIICRVKHNPPETYGDCVRACIATITDDKNVPHTFDGRESEESWSQLRAYLKSKNRFLMLTPVPDPWEFMETQNPGIPYMLLCQNKNGDHAVVCKDGRVWHDPAWYKTDIVGEHSIGCWIVGVIGVLS